MACTDYSNLWEFIVNQQYFDAVMCTYTDQLGFVLVGLMVFGTVGTAVYVQGSGRIAIPAVLAVLVAGVFATNLPPFATQTAVLAVAFALAIIGAVMFIRLRRRL